MPVKSRRGFIKLAAGSAGAALAGGLIPSSIRRALALPANTATGTLRDVEHIVIFMQENRSFDHYFGHLRGVRGYNDRFPIPLPGGRPVWFQPRESSPADCVLPHHFDTSKTSAQCSHALDHRWDKTHAAYRGGRYDRWPANKTELTMGYHMRTDLPFHYALADAFTVCDHYFCSMPGPTHPNRMYLMTGMVDASGEGGGPLIDNNDIVDVPALPPFTWTTVPERLEAAGISWQIYQQGLDFKDSVEGNYGTNVLANFKQFIDAPDGSSLKNRGMSIRRLDALAADVKANRLPQVSWIQPPAIFSEHPSFMPGYGANYTARILDALTGNPEVWSKTVLFIMYDENDGFFDHVVPPMPPTSVLPGKSTVDVAGEIHDVVNPAHQPLYSADNLPYGLGPRVPMTVVSPWSKGGFVCSQVFDHTSVIRFIEARFGIHEPNISAWRRAVCGDLTSALDFTARDEDWPPLPDTSDYRALADLQCRTLPRPLAPEAGAEPPFIVPQEPGTRPARPVPYTLHVEDQVDEQGLRLRFINAGAQGAHFTVYTGAADPRRYTVEAGKSLDDHWPRDAAPRAIAGHDVHAVYGPNGFFRLFVGTAPGITVQPVYVRGDIHLRLTNPGVSPVAVTVTDTAYGAPTRRQTLSPGSTVEQSWPLAASAQWYDLTVAIDDDKRWSRRLAGHVENGAVTTSDPAAVAPVLAFNFPTPG